MAKGNNVQEPKHIQHRKQSEPQFPESDILPGQQDEGSRKSRKSAFVDSQPSAEQKELYNAIDNERLYTQKCSLDCQVSLETSKFASYHSPDGSEEASTLSSEDQTDFATAISTSTRQCRPSRKKSQSTEKLLKEVKRVISTRKDRKLPFQRETTRLCLNRSKWTWTSTYLRFSVKWDLSIQWLTIVCQQLGSVVGTKNMDFLDECSISTGNRRLKLTTEKIRFKDQVYGTVVQQSARVDTLKILDEKVAKTILWHIRSTEQCRAQSGTQAIIVFVVFPCDMPTFGMNILYRNPPMMALSYIMIIARQPLGGFSDVNNSGYMPVKYSKTFRSIIADAFLSRDNFGVKAVQEGRAKISQAIAFENNELNQKLQQCRCILASNSTETLLPVERRIDVVEADGANQQTRKPESKVKLWKQNISKPAKKRKKKVKRSKKKAGRLCRRRVRFVHKWSSGRTEKTRSRELDEECDASNCLSLKAYYPVEEPGNKQPPPHLQDENQRWASFHKLGRRRLPTQTLSRNGFYLNNDNMAQCHSCSRIVELSDAASSPSSENWHGAHCLYINRQRQVASDTPGRVSDDVRDPPGQQSIYIPPGDVRDENYRLSTFEQFSVTCSSSRRSLASSGFYFTGFFDRVKCFACGRTVEQWDSTDNPADIKWHKIACLFVQGLECGNTASTSHFNRFLGNVSTRPVQRIPGEEVLEQTDPVTGAVIRTVRFPTDLPERIRQTGGIFDVGPNNRVSIQSGQGPVGSTRSPGLQRAVPAPARLQPTPAQQARHQPMREWRMANVISADHKRFLTNLYLNRELDRVASFARWPTGRPNVAPAALAKTGFFYLGDMDRTQCFSCGGVLRNWTSEDDAAAEHRTHFPNCRLELGNETRNVPVPDLSVPSDVRQRDFPCRFPANPHMRSEAARLETFDRRWSRDRTAATPAEIAQAGFFFLGERDRAKCWYCNGGLQHWDYDDVPWIEHAKWFPNCQFLLSVKGQHFVYRHLAMNPQLPRPIIARQDGSPLYPGTEPRAAERPEDIPPGIGRIRQPSPSPPPTIIDPQEEMRKKRERVENVLKNSDTVKNVLAMGFSERIVRMLLLEKVDAGAEENPDDIYGSTAGLLDDVMKKEEEIKLQEEQRSNVAAAGSGPSTSFMPSVYSSMSTPQSSLGPAPGSGKYNVSYMDDEDEERERDMYSSEPMSGPSSVTSVTAAKQIEGEEDTASLQEALNKIEEERMCKVCFSNLADVVFVPCGHMCCCMECTQALRQCPVCRIKIEKAIKTYLA